MDMCSPDRTIGDIRADVRDALALAVAVGVVGVSFGALAAAAGVPLPLTMAMSLLVLAGGAQFLAVAVVAAGGGPVAAVAGGLLLNVRHLPFGLAVANVVGDRWPARVLGAHILIDEVVAFARARGSGVRARRAYWTSGILLATFWNAGTMDVPAVQAFLEGRAGFTSISDCVGDVLAAFTGGTAAALDDVLAADRWSRQRATEVLGRIPARAAS